jgi:hypothetical protein
MGAVIRDGMKYMHLQSPLNLLYTLSYVVLVSGDHIEVKTSLDPTETR